MRYFFVSILVLTLSSSLSAQAQQSPSSAQNTTIMYPNDPHSHAKPNEAVVTHLDLTLAVDFEASTLEGVARWTFKHTGTAPVIIFDAKDLLISKVTLEQDGKETPAKFTLGERDAILGQALTVEAPQNCTQVNIYYTTTAGAAALQWLKPEQTAEKTSPFLFTQSQAILARTWIPCQDGPGIRFTYRATVTVPKNMLALMSAENPQQKNETGVYHFTMPQPIPSYLMALAVGDIVFENIGSETGVYAQPSMIQKCAWEFTDMQKMLEAAEKLYGKYEWGRYDVIVLPPSFPFGGMENPRLTFATPTIITGDRSLVALVAHEMAHSWSGNLVTNATWDDFWLNEGFTVYFENRIMEALYGNAYEDMLEVLGHDELKATLDELGDTSVDTHLKLQLAGRDPDDGMNDIAYEKGNAFLQLLERTVGRESFDAFVNNWFHENKFQSRTTEEFVAYLNKNLIEPNKAKFAGIDINEWIYGPGLPANAPVMKSERFDRVDEELVRFHTGTPASELYTADWSTHEWLRFLQNLRGDITIAKMQELDAAFHFTTSENAEIEDVWFDLAIRRKYTLAYPAMENFLISVGRRKFLTPLYKSMVNTGQKELAVKIYTKARPGYHAVAQGTMDELLQWK